MTHIVPQNLLGDPAGDWVRSQVFARRSASAAPAADALSPIQAQSLLRHMPQVPVVQPGTGISIAYNALGPVVSSTVTGSDIGETMAMLPRPTWAGRAQSGTDITVSYNALGPSFTIANDAVTYAKMQNAAANTFIARAANSSGDLSEVALAASQLAGRGSSGDIAAIGLAAGLVMTGTTLGLTGSVGGVGCTLLGTNTLGSVATVLTVSSLDLSAYKSFLVVFSLKNATGSAVNTSIYFNSDTTATNYWKQNLTVLGTTVTGARANDSTPLAMIATNGDHSGHFFLHNDVSGQGTYEGQARRDHTSNLGMHHFGGHWTSATNITGITLSASVATSLDTGSYMHVWGFS